MTPDGAVAYATVLVLVLDINDNSPVFPSPGETALLSEQTPMGSLVELSGASDRDRGVNGTVTYSLTTALNEEMQIIDIPFVLNVYMLPLVFLQVSAQLDYENKQTYQVSVVVVVVIVGVVVVAVAVGVVIVIVVIIVVVVIAVAVGVVIVIVVVVV